MTTSRIPLSMIEDRVLVEVVPLETSSPGGIIIPQTAMKEKSVREGTVVAVGTDPRCDEVAGQQVMFHHIGSFQIFNDDGDEFYVVEFGSILGIVEPVSEETNP